MRTLLVAVLAFTSVVLAGPKKAPAEAAPAPAPSANYVSIESTVSSSPEYQALLQQADAALEEELLKYEVDLAPDGESAEASAQAAKAKGTTGVRIRLTLTAAREQMRASLLVTRLPGNALRGMWNVHASGPLPADLVEAIVPAIVEETAADLGWKKKAPAP